MEEKKHSRRLTVGKIFSMLKETVKEWSADKAPRLGAALAYYTVFSIAPLVIIAILIAGLVFDNAQAQIVAEIKSLVGDKGGAAIESMIEAAQKPVESAVATVLAFGTLLFGAAGVFIQLKDAFNTIWNVPQPKSSGIWGFVRKYFLSFSMVLGIGFLLLVSLLLEAGLAVVGRFFEDRLPGATIIMPAMGLVVSFGIITLLFALLFKFLPDVKVPWRDVWIGAALTTGLFVVGKIGLGVYLGKASVGSAYGAAGSLVLILLWVYYSAQILFFGAEFTQVYSKRHGSRCPLDEEPPRPRTRKERLLLQIEKDRKKLAAMSKPSVILKEQVLGESPSRFEL